MSAGHHGVQSGSPSFIIAYHMDLPSLNSLFFGSGGIGSSNKKRAQVRTHRLLSVLGAVFVPVLGTLFAAAHPGATDPTWARLGLGGLFAGLLVASYASKTVRRRYPEWMRAILYVVMGWFATIAAINGFEGEYDMGLLLVYGVLPPVVGLGATSMRPVWCFLGFGLLAGGTGIILGEEPVWELLVLSTSMVTVAIVEGMALRGQLMVQKEAERLNDLFDRAQDIASIGAWELDLQAGSRFWTDEVFKVYGLPVGTEPTFGHEIDLYHPDDRLQVREAFRQAIEDGDRFDIEVRLGPDGAPQASNGSRAGESENDHEHWVHLRGEPLATGGSVTRIRGTVQNVTERKWRERQLQDKNRRLDSFARLLSHDLRNPLNVASGQLEIVKEKIGESLKASDHLEAVGRALGRMNTIIDDVLTLTWSRQEVGAEELTTLRLAELAESSWSHVDTAQASLQIDSDVSFRANEARLRRLLENLFRNAVEHGGQAVTVQVGHQEGGFYIENDGPPIPPDKRNEVVKSGYSTEDEGTGLGLSIVTSIAEAHGWSVAITDREEGGVRFEIRGAAPRGNQIHQ